MASGYDGALVIGLMPDDLHIMAATNRVTPHENRSNGVISTFGVMQQVAFVCSFVCVHHQQDNSKSCKGILVKFAESIDSHGTEQGKWTNV